MSPEAEKLKAKIEARGYRVVQIFDADVGDILEARVGTEAVAWVLRFRTLEEGLRELAEQLGLSLEDLEV